jgi:hypothetical protein
MSSRKNNNTDPMPTRTLEATRDMKKTLEENINKMDNLNIVASVFISPCLTYQPAQPVSLYRVFQKTAIWAFFGEK